MFSIVQNYPVRGTTPQKLRLFSRATPTFDGSSISMSLVAIPWSSKDFTARCGGVFVRKFSPILAMIGIWNRARGLYSGAAPTFEEKSSFTWLGATKDFTAFSGRVSVRNCSSFQAMIAVWSRA